MTAPLARQYIALGAEGGFDDPGWGEDVNANDIFRKTHKGLEEIERRIYRLTPRERLLLIQVDGKRPLGALAGKAGLDQEGLDTANKLLAAGFIEVIGAIRLPGPLPTRPEIPLGAPDAALGGSLPASRPALPPAPPRPAAQAASLEPRQVPTPLSSTDQKMTQPRAAGTGAAQPTPAPRSVQSPPPRTEQRPANWLTSTVAHLTNLFTGGDTEPEPPRRTVRPPVEHRPAAAQRPAERNHLAHLLASTTHDPIIDLTAESEPQLAIRPATSDPRSAQGHPRQAAPVGRPSGTDPAMQALLAATTAHVPVVDLTEASEHHFHDDASVSALVKQLPHEVPPQPPSAKPPAPNHADAFEANACPQRATCPGCPRCPGNSVSMARSFMKDNLIRLSGKATSSLIQVLDQCRTLAELQRQFEPWLRDLLQTTEGVTEAPNLAGKLQRMLLQ
jgi:hypothetical protein